MEIRVVSHATKTAGLVRSQLPVIRAWMSMQRWLISIHASVPPAISRIYTVIAADNVILVVKHVLRDGNVIHAPPDTFSAILAATHVMLTSLSGVTLALTVSQSIRFVRHATSHSALSARKALCSQNLARAYARMDPCSTSELKHARPGVVSTATSVMVLARACLALTAQPSLKVNASTTSVRLVTTAILLFHS